MSLRLADPGNLLLIIPAFTLQPSEPGNPPHLICAAAEMHKRSPLNGMFASPGNNHIMTIELLHAPYYPIALCGSNSGIIKMAENKRDKNLKAEQPQ